jgi:hypothetical protein
LWTQGPTIVFSQPHSRCESASISPGKAVRVPGRGSGCQEARFFDIDLTIPALKPMRFRAPIGFTTSLNTSGYGLLGQHGFFDRFQVTFNRSRGLFVLDLEE